MTPNERAKAALRYQNRKNRAQGAFFEQMINGACDFYRSRQIADIEKTPEPMQPTKDLGGGKFIAHYTSTAQADYKGFLFGGRAVNFEAKYTDVEKMTQDRVTADQTERLERAGTSEVAVDSVGAGTGEIVIVCKGSSARYVFGKGDAPVDTSIVGIVDTVEVG